MLLVGTPTPTLRSFLMTGLVLIAVMLDRTPLSMRLVAWAAAAVIAVAPDSLFGPSFQMSFGAVVALIAVYEGGRARVLAWMRGLGGIGRPLLYLGGVALTTVVASLATAPFGLYHFQRLQTYGALSNLLVVPLTTFWIMPWGLLAYLLMPLGAEALALVPMGWGIGAMLWLARIAASWPGAALAVPAMPDWGLGLTALGGLWLCLWRRTWRLAGIAAIGLGLASIALAARPDILIGEPARDGAVSMAVRLADGRLAVTGPRSDAFVHDTWLRLEGQSEAAAWPAQGATPDGTLSCDRLGCLYRRGGRVAALVRDPLALSEDCATADLVAGAVAVPRWCRAGTVIGRFDLWRHGAHAVTLDGTGIRVERAGDRVGDRPWSMAR